MLHVFDVQTLVDLSAWRERVQLAVDSDEQELAAAVSGAVGDARFQQVSAMPQQLSVT